MFLSVCIYVSTYLPIFLHTYLLSSSIKSIFYRPSEILLSRKLASIELFESENLMFLRSLQYTKITLWLFLIITIIITMEYLLIIIIIACTYQ